MNFQKWELFSGSPGTLFLLHKKLFNLSVRLQLRPEKIFLMVGTTETDLKIVGLNEEI